MRIASSFFLREKKRRWDNYLVPCYQYDSKSDKSSLKRKLVPCYQSDSKSDKRSFKRKLCALLSN